jgi:hypothetical protein
MQGKAKKSVKIFLDEGHADTKKNNLIALTKWRSDGEPIALFYLVALHCP